MIISETLTITEASNRIKKQTGGNNDENNK